jgi:predicted aconitase with swiveling domain
MEMKDVKRNILKGHKIVGGKVNGEALVCHENMGYGGIVNIKTGKVILKNHELEGINIAGKILVYPTGKGSTASSFAIYELARRNIAPKGIINVKADPVTVSGAIISNIPMVDQLKRDPTKIIRTGDLLELNGDQGTVTIIRRLDR